MVVFIQQWTPLAKALDVDGVALIVSKIRASTITVYTPLPPLENRRKVYVFIVKPTHPLV